MNRESFGAGTAAEGRPIRSGVGVLCLVFLAAVVLLVGAGWWLSGRATGGNAADLVARGRTALDEGDMATARNLSARALDVDPNHASVRLLAGLVALRAGRYDSALHHLAELHDVAGDVGTTALWATGDALFLGRSAPSDAEPLYRRALARDPECLPALQSLSALLGVTARSRAAIPIRLKLVELREFDPLHLHLLCMGDTVLENLELLDRMREARSDDVLTMLGTARELVDQQRPDEAERLLVAILRREPSLVEAHVRLGRLRLAESRPGDDGEDPFASWYASLPEVVNDPDVWSLLGDWCRSRDRLDEAARCYSEAVRLDPQHERAVHQLARTLIAAGDTAAAEPFLARGDLLEQYFSTVKVAWHGGNPTAVREAARIAESLGLRWEAFGWAYLARERMGRPGWAVAAITRLESDMPAETTARAVRSANPALRLDLATRPLPRIAANVSARADREERVPSPREPSADPDRVSFEDQAREAGLDFTYFNGAEPNAQTRRMLEFNGGGVGVVDFDRDGWPDLYLTQGSHWPADPNGGDHLDRLYRNVGGERFEDVTAAAGLRQNGFGGGVAVGDFNADGFPDLYVCNVGGNRFLENNGDGTFTDVTDETGTAGDDWSTSAALADTDGDGLADLYVVNYLRGADVLDRVCPDRGVVRSCSPWDFEAASDRIHRNTGDGRFVDRSAEAGIERPNGKGLGVVVAELNGEPGLDVFVANDAVPNFLFANDGHGRFHESALVAGLAMNGDGRPEACMGVAVDDADGDGRLDLYVTNFHNETNTLYRQSTSGLFVDDTGRSGLAEPSLKMLGFGTQFLDAELDGRPDLIVVNGHVDDLRDVGAEYAMPPQFLRNDGGARFREIDGAQLGDYFTRRHLGRGLALTDWNRDGREDVVVTHLHTPVALLTNTTPRPGRFVALDLVGVESNRDAIGAVVTVESEGRTRSRSLTAGHGFQASNERRLVFGLGDRDRADRVIVHWPSGRVQEHGPLPGNSEWILVEGAAAPVRRAP